MCTKQAAGRTKVATERSKPDSATPEIQQAMARALRRLSRRGGGVAVVMDVLVAVSDQQGRAGSAAVRCRLDPNT
jgi:hypothetical protein